MAAVLPEAAARGFRLEAPFPSWPRRGVPGSVPGADKLVRVDPDEDGTDGFFVALFVRAAAAEGAADAAVGNVSDGCAAGVGSGAALETAERQKVAQQQAAQQQRPGKKKKKRQEH